MRVYLDLETYSEVPIHAGTHAYAASAEILLTAWAIDDGPVSVEDGWSADAEMALLTADEIVIHNSPFDRTVLRHATGVELDTSRLHDTLAQARAHGLPGGLDKLSEIFRLGADDAKDKAGRQMIQLFCKPRPKNQKLRRATADTHPEEWQRFRDYAGRDIIAMRRLRHLMPRWNYAIGTAEHRLWQLDQRINDRGFLADRALAEGAVAAIETEQQRMARRTAEVTYGDLDTTNQRDKLLAHLLAFYGVELPDLRADTLARRLTDETLPGPVRELLAIRASASATSTAKYRRLLGAISADDRMRGTLEYCGAARTGRWAGRIFQPQNLPRPDMRQQQIDEAVDAFRTGTADLVLPDIMRAASNTIRGVIVAPPDHKLVVADLSNIEGRALAWLAGEEWKLQAFADFDQGHGHDLYVLAYSRSFGVSPETVLEDKASGDGLMRQIGKVQELALGYQGSVGAFQSMAGLYGIDLPEERVLSIVRAWRNAHPETRSFWYDLEAVARRAVAQQGVTLECRRLRLRRDGAWLRIVLPSGRALCYPQPALVPGGQCAECDGTGKTVAADEAGQDADAVDCPVCRGRGKLRDHLTYAGINPYTRRWGRVPTYGGKLVENCTQAVARDVLAAGALAAEAAGYAITLSVHDELITEAPDTDEFNAAALAALMAANPPWAAGLPLAAAGFEAHRYRKD